MERWKKRGYFVLATVIVVFVIIVGNLFFSEPSLMKKDENNYTSNNNEIVDCEGSQNYIIVEPFEWRLYNGTYHFMYWDECLQAWLMPV